MNNSLALTLLIFSERLEKISDIRRNIQQSIVVLLSAMDKMRIPLANQDNEDSRNFILKEAGDPESHRRNVSKGFKPETKKWTGTWISKVKNIEPY